LVRLVRVVRVVRLGRGVEERGKTDSQQPDHYSKAKSKQLLWK
jgi:hypothetical protein